MKQTAKPAVLVVDDDLKHIRAVTRVLRRSGFDTLSATTGRSGLESVRLGLADLVLLDLCMPDMSGHQFLRKLRSSKSKLGHERARESQYVPVILVSGCSGSRFLIDALDAGAIDYVTKPFHPDELRARVRAHLRCARIFNQDTETSWSC